MYTFINIIILCKHMLARRRTFPRQVIVRHALGMMASVCGRTGFSCSTGLRESLIVCFQPPRRPAPLPHSLCSSSNRFKIVSCFEIHNKYRTLFDSYGILTARRTPGWRWRLHAVFSVHSVNKCLYLHEVALLFCSRPGFGNSSEQYGCSCVNYNNVSCPQAQLQN